MKGMTRGEKICTQITPSIHSVNFFRIRQAHSQVPRRLPKCHKILWDFFALEVFTLLCAKVMQKEDCSRLRYIDLSDVLLKGPRDFQVGRNPLQTSHIMFPIVAQFFLFLFFFFLRTKL